MIQNVGVYKRFFRKNDAASAAAMRLSVFVSISALSAPVFGLCVYPGLARHSVLVKNAGRGRPKASLDPWKQAKRSRLMLSYCVAVACQYRAHSRRLTAACLESPLYWMIPLFHL